MAPTLPRPPEGGQRRVLLAGDGDELLRRLGERLRRLGLEVGARPGPRPDLLVLATGPDRPEQALESVRRLRGDDAALPVVLLAGASSEELAVAALKAGVDDYFRTPCPLDPVVESVRRLLAARPPVTRPGNGPAAARSAAPPPQGPRLVGSSGPIRTILDTVRRIAPTDTTVLITGETGTGKDLVARLIHHQSPRRRQPFVCVNCAAVPDSLLESELFGHERGAFTGAVAQRRGEFERATRGTLFLDEIGDMSPRAQVKILRALETREVYRLGGQRAIPVDIRVVAATNHDLERMVAEGTFREDLFYRLHVVRLHLPPLRDRKEDLPHLSNHCLERLRARLGLRTEGLTAGALGYLLRHDWPGNVRELQNLIESVAVTRPSRTISTEDLPEAFRRRLERPEALPTDEKERLLAALLASNWNKSRAARKLRCSRMTLYRRLAKHRIPASGPAPPAN